MYAVCFVLIIAALGCVKDVTAFDVSLDIHWRTYIHKHEKIYTSDEESHRRQIWEENIRSINRHNLEFDLGLHTYRQGVNWYTDRGYNEITENLNARWLNSDSYEDATAFSHPLHLSFPDTFDWRDRGCVTSVKDMGPCFAPWAFSAIDAVESQICIQTGSLVLFSEQKLIDCCRINGNSGCDGGTVINAYRCMEQNGLPTEEPYPYTGVPGPCRNDPDNDEGIHVVGYVRFSSTSEDLLKWAVANIGPISVVIDARSSFFFYSGGIYDDPDCSSTDVNYSVLVVGYGSENGQDYWIVKNSQGRSYGEDGYIRMSRNKNNQCGIATSASYPLISVDASVPVSGPDIGDLPSLDLSDFPTHFKF